MASPPPIDKPNCLESVPYPTPLRNDCECYPEPPLCWMDEPDSSTSAARGRTSPSSKGIKCGAEAAAARMMVQVSYLMENGMVKNGTTCSMYGTTLSSR